MKYSCFSSCGRILPHALLGLLLFGPGQNSSAQEKKSAKPKAPIAAKGSAGSAKPAVSASKYDQFLSANMKLLNVLGRYADTLSGATDAATASLAVNQIDSITKDVITAGEELVKLGRPTPEIQAKLAKDPDLTVTSLRVAEQTRAAVKSLGGNADAKALLTPAIDNFQSALNRIQQDADDPKGAGSAGKPKSAIASTPAGKPAASKPAQNAPASKKGRGAPAPAAGAAPVAPPPPPSE